MWKLLNGDRQPFPDYRFTIVAHLTSNAYLVHTVDSDSQCEGDLVCFQRDSVEAVPGCDGTGSSGWDYCYKPNTLPPTPPPITGSLPLTDVGDELFEDNGYLYKECEGDCGKCGNF